MDTKQVIENFYHGLSEKSNKWQENLAENVQFSDASGKLHAKGRDEFIQAFTPFLKSVEKVEITQMIIENNNACSVISYTYVNPKNEKMQQTDAEVWKIENGKITSLTIYFDITEFRNFMKN